MVEMRVEGNTLTHLPPLVGHLDQGIGPGIDRIYEATGTDCKTLARKSDPQNVRDREKPVTDLQQLSRLNRESVSTGYDDVLKMGSLLDVFKNLLPFLL